MSEPTGCVAGGGGHQRGAHGDGKVRGGKRARAARSNRPATSFREQPTSVVAIAWGGGSRLALKDDGKKCSAIKSDSSIDQEYQKGYRLSKKDSVFVTR